ncbi:MAG: ATP-binding cassette domain-containing protein [Campylobacterota bacterium]|nr:ATP-binding cassette domain-containing protein [Campylobacterota bacterium]
MAEMAVKVSNFVKTYKKKIAVDRVSLNINKGEVFGLIGPDGAGKSTLMKAIAGILKFDEGIVQVFGINVDSERSAEKIKSHLGFMPQGLGLNLYPELSIEENINFFAHLRSVPKDRLFKWGEQLLDMTRLKPFKNRRMKHLSGGMKQKLGLICTLIHEPELLILDEPTTGVDPVSRKDFWEIMAHLLGEKNVTALVSTAYLDEAMRFNHLALMFKGKILAQGEPDEILKMIHGSSLELVATPHSSATDILSQVFQTEATGNRIRLFVEGKGFEEAKHTIEKILKENRIEIKDIYAREPELEDVFIALLKKEHPDPDSDSSPRPSFTYSPSIAPSFSHPPSVAIEAKKITKYFGKFCAVDNASFSVQKGKIFGLLGPNGAGKTTLIKMLCGIIPPTGGNATVAGVDIHHIKAVKERIGYMSQIFSLYRDLTVKENIKLYAGIYGLDKKETRMRLDWIIDMAGLKGREWDLAGRLPMGIRQRLALGCALVHKPEVLFLDEPTSGVDPIGRRTFWDIVFYLSREENVTILVTTHYMKEAEHCDCLALMYAAKIIADDSPQRLKQDVVEKAGILIKITTYKPFSSLKILRQAGFKVTLYGNDIHLLTPNPQKDVKEIKSIFTENDIEIESVSKHPLSMEDVFVHNITSLEESYAN